MVSYKIPQDFRHATAFVASIHQEAGATLSPPNPAPWSLPDPITLEDILSAIPLPRPAFTNPPAKARPCILVVDDDDFAFDLLEDTFSKEYEVLFATDGLTALQIASERTPELILLDVVMPSIDGYEVCRRLKAQHATRDIPVIFLSGLSNMLSETTGLELGAVDYITKPINASAVKVKARNQIQFRRAFDSLVRGAHLEKELRDDLLAVLELKSRDQPVN
jgi:PleD family two-component response regulator